jgi:hypothetical protein
MAMSSHFGSCCKDLADAMSEVPNSFFRVEANGVLYLSVGFVSTDNGPGYFDQAVLFCPFCGTELQSKQTIVGRDAS